MDHAVEVVDHVRVKLLHDLGVHPTHLLAASGEIAHGVDEIFGEVGMLFVGVVHGVDAVVLRLEPLHGQLEQVHVPVEVLGHAGQSFQADLGDLEIVAVTAT